MRRPLVFVTFAYILGILLGRALGVGSFLLIALALSPALILLYLKGSHLFCWACFITLFFAWGGLSPWAMDYLKPSHHLAHFIPRGPVDLVGRLYWPPEGLSEGERIYLKVEKARAREVEFPLKGKARVNLYREQPRLEYGDEVLIPSLWLFRPRRFLNPGAFDYRAHLARRGIHAVGGTSRRVRTLHRGGGWAPLRALYRVRERMLSAIDAAVPKPQGEILKSMTLGERAALEPEVKEIFLRSGTAHLLAISGLHVGFVLLFLLVSLRAALKRLPPRLYPTHPIVWTPTKAAALLSIPAIILFALLTGARVSTVRAAIMVVGYLLSKLLERERELPHALMLAALLILLWEPGYLFDAGFQLSFASVLAIVLVLPRLSALAGGLKGRFLRFWMVTLVVVAVTLPLTALHFQSVYPVGMISNLVMIPMASVLVPLSLTGSLLALILPALGALFLKGAGLLSALLMGAGALFSSLPLSSLRVSPPPPWALIAYYLGFGLFLLLRSGWGRRIAFSGGALALVLSLLLPFSFSARPSGARVIFLDAGPGDATLVRLPNGKSLFIEGGRSRLGRFDIGKLVVAPYLRREGIFHLDFLFRIGRAGASSLEEELTVGETLFLAPGPELRRASLSGEGFRLEPLIWEEEELPLIPEGRGLKSLPWGLELRSKGLSLIMLYRGVSRGPPLGGPISRAQVLKLSAGRVRWRDALSLAKGAGAEVVIITPGGARSTFRAWRYLKERLPKDVAILRTDRDGAIEVR
ncbi:MAG: ComEC/Rec2 family competence protein, partial [Nitrospinota bacterium]